MEVVGKSILCVKVVDVVVQFISFPADEVMHKLIVKIGFVVGSWTTAMWGQSMCNICMYSVTAIS